MRVSYNWLRELVRDLPDPDEVATRLTLAGLEVERVIRPDARLLGGLVTARIVELEKHPNADRLTVCRVDDGAEVVPIVCGATNMKAGDAVVLARPGALLPDGRKIQRSKIRGAESRGMLCAATEIGIADDSPGIMILDSSVTPGLAAASLLGIDDVVLEIGVTPNRGDCLSVRGVAREISAICGLELLPAFDRAMETHEGAGRISVRIEEAEGCSLYAGVEIRGVTVGPSPAWLTARLRACDLRPISNIVDVTNYVLWEYGQPLHAFDADLLEGPEISVGRASEQRVLVTLDGQERNLHAADLVIRDRRGAVALAGVMGGARTAVNDRTRNVFLESAVFAPSRVRATSRRLGLISDSSYRFERGVDVAAVERALGRAAALIAEVAGGRVEHGVSRAGRADTNRIAITLRPMRISRLLGVEVAVTEVAEVLTRLGSRVESSKDGSLTVVPPSYRHDLEREVDLIEEVARLRGYETIEAVPPFLLRVAPASRAGTVLAGRVRGALCARGLSEVIALAFSSPAWNRRFNGLHADSMESVTVENPLRSDAEELRRSLIPALLAAWESNVRNGVPRGDLFSLAKTFSVGQPVVELNCVAGLLAGPRRTRGPRDDGAPEFGDVKGVVEHILAAAGCRETIAWLPRPAAEDLHPRVSALVRIGDRMAGYAGEVHPDVLDQFGLEGPLFVFELDLETLSACRDFAPVFRPLPRFPASTRDVSVLVAEDVTAGRVIDEALGVGEVLLENVAVFDEYRGAGVPAGRRALAFRMTYRATDRTLTEDEVASTHSRVLDRLVNALGVELRA